MSEYNNLKLLMQLRHKGVRDTIPAIIKISFLRIQRAMKLLHMQTSIHEVLDSYKKWQRSLFFFFVNKKEMT